MLDRFVLPLLQPVLTPLARTLARCGVGANAVTLAALATGLGASAWIAAQGYLLGALGILLSRLLDGLDGALARQTQPTDAGGFLDIVGDFLFYASVPLAFAVADPTHNALASATLLAAFLGTGSSFLAFAALAAKRGLRNPHYPTKSFYFLGGLTEGFETLACFVAMCLWPQHFAALAYGFSTLCVLTIATRLWWGWKALQ
ncbi:CDP-alcohol phosphatidyltransferase family protein [Curvibacter sp. APW13]|uniref:CDP-alcohol phosphatidyltransferase family protein n=1 Tax=Curvibacter sp. APW13 TaxID=3077236 RepID=UPI0028DE49F8|nr:CDP-alcohol phosphatidyltransferase family protein [Curvibacter sp. APW13]MDT8992500.1 CDP-alcohol phosphatidyltransferase family protein [Curvibacter sp. APW13]